MVSFNPSVIHTKVGIQSFSFHLATIHFFLEKEGFYMTFVVVKKGRLYIQRTADNFIANDNFLVIINSKSNLIKKERQRNETY